MKKYIPVPLGKDIICEVLLECRENDSPEALVELAKYKLAMELGKKKPSLSSMTKVLTRISEPTKKSMRC